MKSFLTYALMVGIPAAGVLGVLHAGRGLRAPHAVGGEWRIQAGPLAGSTLVVQQSGEHLSLVLPGGVRLNGNLRGDTVEASGAGHATACGADRGTTLRARVDASATPRRMTGVVGAGADGCPASPLEAVREYGAARRGGGH